MKTILLGFDAFDPIVFERLLDQGKMPNLEKLVKGGGYARFGVSNPAQSEVSWTSIATGLNPGGHGIFDFVHRNPANYVPFVSLLPTTGNLFGVRFTPPHNAQTIFDYTARQGFPATALWWPTTFPARLDSPVQTIPGLGTPDIFGRLGAGIFFTPAPDAVQDERKTRIEPLLVSGSSKFRGVLHGPLHGKGTNAKSSAIDFQFELFDEDCASLKIGKQPIELRKGCWSPILELSFPMRLGFRVHAITRVIWNDHYTDPGLYFLPLQIHPLHPLWPYTNPPRLGREPWDTVGRYLTLGWPQDTTGLEEGFIHDDQFLALCDSIRATRERIFGHHLQRFEEGVLAMVLDTLDRVQHMFWRDRQDIVEGWYQELDALFGRVQEQIHRKGDRDVRLLVLSDHGFADFTYKVNLNRWLIERQYLTPKSDRGEGKLSDVNWEQTRAYAIGLNSLYLNEGGREARGIVIEAEKPGLIASLKEALLAWKSPDGRSVVNNVWSGEEAFNGPLAPHSPDLVLGYNTGYRASADTGMGGWTQDSLERNDDHWGADHCIDPTLVPGTLFSNIDLTPWREPSYRDVPELTLGTPMDSKAAPPLSTPKFSAEDEQTIEERLRDLGYL